MALLLHGRCSLAPLIILLSLIVGLSGAAVRPVVTFTPPWNKILHGDAVRMTCDVDAAEQGDVTYTWYRNNKWTHTGKSFIILPTQSRHGGNYQCGTSEDNISEAVTLSVTKGPIVLQAPPFIYEGDDLPLRCHGDPRNEIVFYRNNKMINASSTDPEILVRDHRDETAVYRCQKQDYTTYSDETVLTVPGAAASFVVTSYPNWRKVFTGESITLFCGGEHYGTHSWYKDYRLLKKTDQNFITIQSALRSDSGRYQCATRSDPSPAVSLDVRDGKMNLFYIIFFGYILILPEKTLSQVNGAVEQPARDCSDIWQRNKHFSSGVYTVKPVGAKTAFKVYCKISKVGGWTLIQKHNGEDGLSFEKSWLEYENGFGNLRGEHWLGLEKMHLLTHQKGRKCKLRIGLGDFAGNKAYAEYNPFRIGDAKTFYRLSAGKYSGSAGDAFAGNNEIEGDNERCSRFSAEDKPNDNCWPRCISGGIMFLSCSRQKQAGWWFNACGSANLNGIWREPPNYKNWASSVSWPTWRPEESLKFSEMYLIHE